MIGQWVKFKEYPVRTYKNKTKIGMILRQDGYRDGLALYIIQPIEEIIREEKRMVSRYWRTSEQIKLLPNKELMIEML